MLVCRCAVVQVANRKTPHPGTCTQIDRGKWKNKKN